MELIIYGLVVLFIVYFVLFFHELGHAIFAIIFTKKDVSIKLGGNVDKVNFRVGRLLIYLNGFSPNYGVVYWNNTSLSKIKKIIICIGGPLFSLLLSLALWYFLRYNTYEYINYDLVEFLLIYSVIQFVVTIIPIKYPKFWGGYAGMNSDGLNAIKCLMEKQ